MKAMTLSESEIIVKITSRLITQVQKKGDAQQQPHKASWVIICSPKIWLWLRVEIWTQIWHLPIITLHLKIIGKSLFIWS